MEARNALHLFRGNWSNRIKTATWKDGPRYTERRGKRPDFFLPSAYNLTGVSHWPNLARNQLTAFRYQSPCQTEQSREGRGDIRGVNRPQTDISIYPHMHTHNLVPKSALSLSESEAN